MKPGNNPRALLRRWLVPALCLAFSGLVRAVLPLELHSGPGPGSLTMTFPQPGLDSEDKLLVIATSSGPDGAALVPLEGLPLFLPFQADHVLLVRLSGSGVKIILRSFNGFGLGQVRENPEGVRIVPGKAGSLSLEIPRSWAGTRPVLETAAALCDMSAGAGQGSLLDSTDPFLFPDQHSRYISHALSFDLPRAGSKSASKSQVIPRRGGRVRIYQMLPRLFGNANTSRIPNGTGLQNGCGKFADLNDRALASLKELGFDAIWVTGVLRQATTSDYSRFGLPPDDPDLVKGIAGSPYAVRDYYDVCPDYAIDPGRRLEEFKELLARAASHGLRIFIDFVPNHVARSYASVVHPERDFGRDDKKEAFFSGDDFYYLQPGTDGPPLRLPSIDPVTKEFLSPTAGVIQADKENRFPGMKEKIDGLFDPENEHGRVTGDNQNTWRPGPMSWSETCKLNYGYDFTRGAGGERLHPTVARPDASIPGLWEKMDAILAYWQEMGVDGFRCDASHMIPAEFWHWALARARKRNPQTYFFAECYEGDVRLEVPDANPALAEFHSNPTSLLEAGFDAVYGHAVFKSLQQIYGGKASANDLDAAAEAGFVSDNAVRYAENHDEARLASPRHWKGLGAAIGRPVCAILFGLSRGPAMIYYGQEVGERADAGAAGFEGDSGRTTFFDYWSIPELQKWVNDGRYDGGGLGKEQTQLREFYGRLLHSLRNPALADGNFYPLNPTNAGNPTYGRLNGEKESGRWLYAFLRHIPSTRNSVLVVANLHPTESFSGVNLRLPPDVIAMIVPPSAAMLTGTDLLAASDPSGFRCATGDPAGAGIPLPEIPPLSAFYFELSTR